MSTDIMGLSGKRVAAVAKAMASFLSDMSPYITGQATAVDGGCTAAGPLPYRPLTERPRGVMGGFPK